MELLSHLPCIRMHIPVIYYSLVNQTPGSLPWRWTYCVRGVLVTQYIQRCRKLGSGSRDYRMHLLFNILTCDISVMSLLLYFSPCPSASISSKNSFLSSISFSTSSNLSASVSGSGCGLVTVGAAGSTSESLPNAITFCSFCFSLVELYPMKQ